jgi:hypothetical protein
MMKRTAIMALFFTVLAVVICGCGRGQSARERTERTYHLYQEINRLLDGLMDFTYTLEGFDLEDAEYLEKARRALEESRGKLKGIEAAAEELRDFDYGKELADLEEAMRDYLEELDRAMGETAAIMRAAEDILGALEPTLKVEAELTLMDPPENNQVQLERLIRLDHAITETLARLQGIEVPESMRLYKELNGEMFASLQRTARLLMQAIRSEIPITEQPSNPDFDRFQLILENYREVVRSMHENLKLYQLDELARKVDEAFYQLFIEYPEEER